MSVLDSQMAFPARLLSPGMHSKVLLALCFILGGMLALPLVPGWQSATRLLAAIVLARALPELIPRGALRAGLIVLGVAALATAIAWVHSALSSPGRHVIGMVTDIYGLALPVYGGLALTLVDVTLLAGFVRLLLNREVNRRIRLGFALALLVWLWSFSGPLGRGPGAPELFGQMLAGSSEWAGWVILMALCLSLIRCVEDVRTVMVAVVIGGLSMALVMVLQYLANDFAYVLDTPNLSDYFYRVRGTAYYHGPAVYTAALTLALLSSPVFAIPRPPPSFRWRDCGWLLALIALAFLLAINDTRAMNVALMVAFSLTGVLVLWRRDWMAAVIIGCLLAWIGSDVLYVKPTIGGTEIGLTHIDGALQSRIDAIAPGPLNLAPDIHAPPPIGGPDGAVAQTLVGTNSVRIVLAAAGLQALPSYLLIGSGVGTLELDLTGVGGLGTTYSTHILYSDIALMAGLPALLFFMASLLLAFWSGVTTSLRSAGYLSRSMASALLSALVVLGLGAVFLPQERNHIAAFFFVFAALLLAIEACLCATGSFPEAISRRQVKILAALLAIAATGWGVMTSASYTLPVLNLAALYADEIDASRAQVYVPAPTMLPLARTLLSLRGLQDPDVAVLVDDPALLPLDNAFIVWHPSHDRRYPRLHEALRYRQVRPGFDAPAFEFPHTWWMRDVIPYAGHLMQAGSRPAAAVFGPALAATDIPPELPLWPNAGRFLGFAQIGAVNMMSPRDMLDMTVRTHRFWHPAAPPQFYFDTAPLNDIALGAYRLILPTHPNQDYLREFSWRLEGSDDLESWEVLDARAATLSEDVEAPSGFAITNPRVFRYLRFRFDPITTQTMRVGLSEIEIFPTPMTAPDGGSPFPLN